MTGNRLMIGFVVFCGMLLFARSLLCEREPSAKNELVALEQHWLEVEDDPQALDSILAPDFLHVVPAGIITKSDQIDFMRKHPSPEQRATKHFEDMHVRVYGISSTVSWSRAPGKQPKEPCSQTSSCTVPASGKLSMRRNCPRRQKGVNHNCDTYSSTRPADSSCPGVCPSRWLTLFRSRP
jgi:hypothetical protein